MAFLVLGLSCMPCADAFERNRDKTTTEIVKHNDQQDQADHEDACSPFCHCTCCANYSISYPQLYLPPSLSFDDRSYISYLSDNIIEVSIPVWQPPQLV